MLGKLRDISFNRDGTQNITVTVETDYTDTFEELKNVPVNIEIKKASKGRSLSANSFCWALCTMIGQSMTPPVPKDDIYRDAIKAAGVHWQTTIPIFNLDSVRRKWESRGTGWFMEVVDDDKPGRKLVHLYFGSSSYTVHEMKTLLDWLTDQCQQMGLSIPLSKREEQDLLERWGKK